MIRRVRKFQRLKRQAFAHQLRISPPTLDRLEADSPTVDIETIDAAAKALGLVLRREDRTIDEPPGLPPLAPPRRGMAGKRIIAVSPTLYDDLKHLAGKRGVAQYLEEHVRRQVAKPSNGPTVDVPLIDRDRNVVGEEPGRSPDAAKKRARAKRP